MPQLPKKPAAQPWYTIRAAGADTVEVLIYGDIGDSWYGESVTARKFVEDLQAVADKNLVVRINSYGGSVSDGIAIYNAIARHPQPKSVVIDGVAVSIASLIAMAGDTVSIAENGLLMIHAPWGGVVGNSREVRQYADTLDRFAEAMLTSYAAQTKKPAEEMRALLTDGEDHWFTAQEAAEAGFVDEITAVIDPSEAARYRAAAFGRFKVPAAVAAAYRQPQQETTVMPDPNPANPAAPHTPAVTEPTNVVAIETAATAREQARIAARNAEINEAFARFMDAPAIADLHRACLADVTLSAEAARARLLAKLGEGAEPLAPAATGRAHAGEDQRDKRVLGMSEALLGRIGQAQPDAANPWRGHRLHELARECLRASGVKVDGLSMLDVASAVLTRTLPRGAQTTSDFPVILENTLHKLVLTGFEAQTTTYDRFCKIGDVADFRAWNRIVPGLIGNLDSVNEAGEYKNKAIPDGVKNSITATRKGNIISVTPETLVNDDTGYLQSMAAALGAAGPRAIERAVYAVLNANAALSDSVALFHATHANLAGSGAVPSVTTIDAATQALASQKAPGADAEYLGIMGPFIAVVPLAQRLNMQTIAKAPYDPDTANKLQKPNPVAGLLGDVVSSPWLSGTAWYLFANPAQAPVIEVVFLDGQRLPKVTEDVDFRTSGLAWKVELPFGVGAIDFRGGYKNPGA